MPKTVEGKERPVEKQGSPRSLLSYTAVTDRSVVFQEDWRWPKCSFSM